MEQSGTLKLQCAIRDASLPDVETVGQLHGGRHALGARALDLRLQSQRLRDAGQEHVQDPGLRRVVRDLQQEHLAVWKRADLQNQRQRVCFGTQVHIRCTTRCVYVWVNGSGIAQTSQGASRVVFV